MNTTLTDTKSQNNLVLKHLQTHKGGLTQYEATMRYGILRLSARIYDLKARGYNIKGESTYTKNRYGHNTEVFTYYLEE